MNESGPTTNGFIDNGFIDNLVGAARRNPISAALIGMGVVWLFAGKSGVRVGDLWRNSGIDRIPDVTRDTLSSVTSGASEGARAVSNAAGASFSAVRETAADVVSKAADLVPSLPSPANVFGSTRDNLSELFKAQPLALGAIGLAIGAGIAAALPVTDVENEYLGEASASLRTRTVDMAGEQVEKVATRVVHAATEEARKQGLTPEGVKSAAGELAGRVGRVIGAARPGAATAEAGSQFSSSEARTRT
jgi:hypothetical protein